MNWTTEAKVGLFTVIGALLFAASVIFVGRIDLFTPPQMHVTGDFESVTGLKTGNMVKFSGVKVGAIKDMEVSPKGVIVYMDIDEKTQIPVDSEFTMANDGILGDKFISITPGKSTTYIKNGDHIKGEGKSDIDKTMKQATVLMESANKTLNSINGIIGDKNTQRALKATLETTEVIAKNTADLTAQMSGLMAGNADNINAITENMLVVSRNIESLTNQMDQSMKQFNADGQAGTEMRQIMNNLKTTTDSISKMAGAMETVVTDPKSAEDIKETLHNTAQISSKINRLTGGSSRSGGEDGKKSSLNVEGGVDVLYESQHKKPVANASVRIQSNASLYELGLTNLGDGTNLEMIYGKRVAPDLYLRGGLFDGDLGLGVDYGLGRPFSLSAAFMDPKERRYRLRTEVKLQKDTYLVGQIIRPYRATHGGDYLGLRKAF